MHLLQREEHKSERQDILVSPTLILRCCCTWTATTCLQSETRRPMRTPPRGTDSLSVNTPQRRLQHVLCETLWQTDGQDTC